MNYCDYLSRGVLPENLRRGLYAVVDELVLDLTTTVLRYSQSTAFGSYCELLQRMELDKLKMLTGMSSNDEERSYSPYCS